MQGGFYMIRIRYVLWLTALLAACGMSVQIQGSMKSYVEKRCTHLKESHHFREYNQEHFFNEFEISEMWSDGAPYYHLFAKEEGIEVQINKEQTMAKIQYLGKTLKFAIRGFIRTNANIYLADLTGDGFQELIYQEPVSGMSGLSGSCIVVDLQKMKVMQVKGNHSQLCNNVTIEQVADKHVCKVTDTNHHIYFGKPEQDILYIKGSDEREQDSLVVEYDRMQGKLNAYTCFAIPGDEEAGYLGDIRASYEYKTETGLFELSDDYVVTMWNPVVQSERDKIGGL